MLLSLTPFAAFTLLSHAVSVPIALWVAAVLALGLVLSDWLRPGGGVKIIEAGSAIVFSALAVYAMSSVVDGDLARVSRLAANGGLMATSLLSLAIGAPFTLQYARETAPNEALASAGFRRDNYVMTSAWVVVFAIMFGANLAGVFGATPLWIERLIIYVALIGGGGFTFWYIRRVQRRLATAR